MFTITYNASEKIKPFKPGVPTFTPNSSMGIDSKPQQITKLESSIPKDILAILEKYPFKNMILSEKDSITLDLTSIFYLFDCFDNNNNRTISVEQGCKFINNFKLDFFIIDYSTLKKTLNLYSQELSKFLEIQKKNKVEFEKEFIARKDEIEIVPTGNLGEFVKLQLPKIKNMSYFLERSSFSYERNFPVLSTACHLSNDVIDIINSIKKEIKDLLMSDINHIIKENLVPEKKDLKLY